MTDLVLTLIGPDRPGLVESVAEVIAGHGGNWLESRMAHLTGKFAGILRVEIPTDRVAALTAALAALQERGLRVIADELVDLLPGPVVHDAVVPGLAGLLDVVASQHLDRRCGLGVGALDVRPGHGDTLELLCLL